MQFYEDIVAASSEAMPWETARKVGVTSESIASLISRDEQRFLGPYRRSQ